MVSSSLSINIVNIWTVIGTLKDTDWNKSLWNNSCLSLAFLTSLPAVVYFQPFCGTSDILDKLLVKSFGREATFKTSVLRPALAGTNQVYEIKLVKAMYWNLLGCSLRYLASLSVTVCLWFSTSPHSFSCREMARSFPRVGCVDGNSGGCGEVSAALCCCDTQVCWANVQLLV